MSEPTTDFPLGLYLLTEDVPNPHGDRRRVYQFFRLPVMAKGTTLQVFDYPLTEERTIRSVKPIGNHLYGDVAVSSEVGQAVLAKCKPHPMNTLAEVLKVSKHVDLIGAGDVLKELIAGGTLTLDGVKAAIDSARRRRDEA